MDGMEEKILMEFLSHNALSGLFLPYKVLKKRYLIVSDFFFYGFLCMQMCVYPCALCSYLFLVLFSGSFSSGCYLFCHSLVSLHLIIGIF